MMADLISLASVVVVLLAIVAAAVTLVSTRRLVAALAAALDLLMAAGLLHLAARPSYMSAATAAVVLAVRRLVSWGLSGQGQRSGPPGPTRPPATANRNSWRSTS
jgi:hypothetical protein